MRVLSCIYLGTEATLLPGNYGLVGSHLKIGIFWDVDLADGKGRTLVFLVTGFTNPDVVKVCS